MSEQTPGPPEGDEPTQPALPYGAPASPQPPPYGQPPPGYGPPPYGQQPPGYAPPQYGQPPPGYATTPPYGGYPQPTPTPGSTIALVVVSGILTLSCLFGIPSLILGIIALTKVNTDIQETRRLTRIGWIVLGILAAVVVVLAVLVISIAVSSSDSPSTTFETLLVRGTTAPAMVLRST